MLGIGIHWCLERETSEKVFIIEKASPKSNGRTGNYGELRSARSGVG
jgi:hypothetical protein